MDASRSEMLCMLMMQYAAVQESTDCMGQHLYMQPLARNCESVRMGFIFTATADLVCQVMKYQQGK